MARPVAALFAAAWPAVIAAPAAAATPTSCPGKRPIHPTRVVTGSFGTAQHGSYDGLRRGDRLWGRREFRGWGGSSHPEVAISPQGFSSDRVYFLELHQGPFIEAVSSPIGVRR